MSSLNQAINVSVRAAFVLYPTYKAANCLLNIAYKAANSFYSTVRGWTPESISNNMPDLAKKDDADASFIRKAYTKLFNATLPAATDGIEYVDQLKKFGKYAGVAIVATYLANRYIGRTPEFYNKAMTYAGQAVGYDVIQWGVDYSKRA